MLIGKIKKIIRTRSAVSRTLETPDFNRTRETRRRLAYIIRHKN